MADPIVDFKNRLREPAEQQFLAHSHDGFLKALTAMAGLPSMMAQLDNARSVATSAIEQFERDMLPHHAMEEHVLFPAVIQAARTDTERESVVALTGQLTAEHRNVEQLWKKVAPEVQALLEGRSTQLDGELFSRLMRDYSRHVIFEESEFLPMARAILERDPGVP